MRTSILKMFLGGLLAAALHTSAGAQNAGALDPAFDGDGRTDVKVITGNVDEMTTIVNYPGRRYLAAGRCYENGEYTGCLVRINENGSLDTTFGNGGKRVGQLIAGYRTTINRLAVQSDGKILAAARCDLIGGNSQPCHVRLLDNGQLDTAYGSAGGVVAIVGGGTGSGNAAGIAIQSDGKVVVGGHCIDATTYNLCAFRYLSTGALDTGYGTGGTARVTVTPVSLNSLNLLLTPDNAAIVVAYCDYTPGGATAQVCMVRFTPGGVRDTAYVGGSGAPTLPHHTTGTVYEAGTASALQADGAVVLGGYCGSGGTLTMCTARVTPAGALDTSFAGGWSKVTHATLGASSMARGAALQRDGKIVFGVACVDRYKLCTLRLNSDGSLDDSYGTGGVAGVSVSGFAIEVGDGVLDGDERFTIAAGCYGNDGGGITDTCMWRVQRGQSYAGRSCSLDVDDDGVALSANDVLIMTRAAMGFSGNAVTAGITMPASARRTSWADMRTYLVNQCGMSRLR